MLRPPRYLIAGAGGMLGTALQRVLGETGAAFEAPTESDFDITDPAVVERVVSQFAETGPGLLVNAAAYTDVERAEDDTELAYRVNEHGARVLAEAARDAELGFAHVSTDFVFDGTKQGAYVEDDEPNPLSVYGASKLAGERAVGDAYPEALVVRTAWVFGPGGDNFPTKIARIARERGALKVVEDEIGSPTYTVDLARGMIGLAESGSEGLYHLAGNGWCSRLDLARAVLAAAGIDVEVEPVTAAEFPSKAARPANSILDCGKAESQGVAMPAWQDAVRRFASEMDA